MRTLTAFSCMAVLLVGCSAAQVQKTQSVVVKLKADAQTVLVTGCAGAPIAEVLLTTFLAGLPPGTDKDQLASGVAVAEPYINQVCATVNAAQK